MISMRLGGDAAETEALIAVMRAAGIEVHVDTSKVRRVGYAHTYAVARLAGDPDPDGRDPIRVDATLGTPPVELPSGDRRPRRRR